MKIVPRREAKALGLPRYFTGRPCPRGHVAERYTGNKSCVECDRQSPSRAKYRAKRRDIVQELRAERAALLDYVERLLVEQEELWERLCRLESASS